MRAERFGETVSKTLHDVSIIIYNKYVRVYCNASIINLLNCNVNNYYIINHCKCSGCSRVLAIDVFENSLCYIFIF